MKAVLSTLLLCATAAAQSPFIARLNADLRAGDGERFARDIYDRYGKGVVTRGLARELTQALAGRELPVHLLTRLNSSIVLLFDEANARRQTGWAFPPIGSALRELGVPTAEIEIIIPELRRSAQILSGNELRVRPIPPAYAPPPGRDRV